MTTLKEILLTPANRPKLVRDASQLVDDEVGSKGGISGLAIKASYKAVKAIKPGVITDAVDGLIDKFVDRLEPFYADWLAANKTPGFASFLETRSSKVANALLGVTDDRAKQVANSTIRKAYETLRPQGEKHVGAAVPGLGRVVSRYLT